MAVEARRGCGFRKVGGLYMVGGKLAAPCGRLPMELHVCPVCNGGIKQARAWQWVNPAGLLANAGPCMFAVQQAIAEGAASGSLDFRRQMRACRACPLDVGNLPPRAGLIWIGEQFYPRPADFMTEAQLMGVSRRIPAIPRDFVLGSTWVLLAHPKAISREPVTDEETAEAMQGAQTGMVLRLVRKGVISMFLPTAIEKIVTASQARDDAAMAELARRGITPVIVPDDDPDHQPGKHAREDSDDLPLEDAHAST